MVYRRNEFCFIHIPRTGGISLTTAFASNLQLIEARGVLISTGHFPYVLRRHARAHELSTYLADWDQIARFAVIRNPWRAIESNYRRMRSFAPGLKQVVAADRDWYETFVSAVRAANSLPFADWVPHFYAFMVEGTGHWWHYCLADDGADLGVKAFRYEELSEHWPQLAEQMGIPGADLPRCNQVESAACQWRPDAVEFVRSRFADDLNRFRYPQDPYL